MSRPLVRLLTTDGLPIYVLPARVTQVVPATDRISDEGSQPRSVIYVSVPHTSCAAPRGQVWDTEVIVVRGTPDDVTAELWPNAAAKP